MNIKELLDNDGIKLKKVSGREYAGACPFCGGRDRFRVWPDEDGGGFWCRVCNRHGNMVKYHMLTTGKKYFDACYDLGVEPRFKPRQRSGRTFETVPLPPMAWRKQAGEVVKQCHGALMSQIGPSMRSWLAARGIKERSMEKAYLGLNKANSYFTRQVWGLAEEVNPDTGKPKKVWIPAGLVIPCFVSDRPIRCFVSDEPIRLRVRRQPAEDGNRYVTVSGSNKQPMRLGCQPCVVVVESDLDAILVSQEAGDLVTVIALGSVSLRPDAETHKILRSAEIILLSLDFDQAGAKQVQWWRQLYGAKVKRWPVPSGKDPGEAYQAEYDIKTWINVGLGNGN